MRRSLRNRSADCSNRLTVRPVQMIKRRKPLSRASALTVVNDVVLPLWTYPMTSPVSRSSTEGGAQRASTDHASFRSRRLPSVSAAGRRRRARKACVSSPTTGSQRAPGSCSMTMSTTVSVTRPQLSCVQTRRLRIAQSLPQELVHAQPDRSGESYSRFSGGDLGESERRRDSEQWLDLIGIAGTGKALHEWMRHPNPDAEGSGPSSGRRRSVRHVKPIAHRRIRRQLELDLPRNAIAYDLDQATRGEFGRR